jgi:hypothetical protein
MFENDGVVQIDNTKDQIDDKPSQKKNSEIIMEL